MFNICSDPSINQDTKFLDALHDVFEQNETSTVFKTHIKKMKAAFYEAQRSVKKRITDVGNNTVVEQEDKANIFEIVDGIWETALTYI